MNKLYDAIIIGAGPIGLACGIEAEKNKLDYLIIEKGCLVNSIYNYPVNMVFFSTSDRLEIGNVPFISHGMKPTRTEALEYYRRVKSTWDLQVNTYEKVNSVEGNKNNFTIHTSKEEYRSKNIIVAIGFYDNPNFMNIPGEELPKVKHYYDDAHPYSDQKIIVVGGGNSAVDVALETYRRGADVTMVVKNNSLDEGVKYWVKPDIENRIKEGSIKSFFNSKLTEISEKFVILNSPKGEVKIENDFVLAMTGYHPDYRFLKSIGIEFSVEESKIPQYDSSTFETNIKGVYLAGVVCGGMETGKWFIENSRFHAENIIKVIAENNLNN